MDADYQANENDPVESGERKRKGRSRFARVVAQKKPVFDPGVFYFKGDVARSIPIFFKTQR